MFRNANGSFTVRHSYRRNYQTHTVDLFTVAPSKKFTIHVGNTLTHGGYHLPDYHNTYQAWNMDAVRKRLLDLTPLQPRSERYYSRYWAEPFALGPERGPKPKAIPESAHVDHPFWAPSGDYRRAAYEAKVKEHGTLENWYEAYDTYQQKVSQRDLKLRVWQDAAFQSVFPGVVIDEKGTVSPRSIERRRQAEARALKEYNAEQERLRAAEEVERKRTEAEKAKLLKAARKRFEKAAKGKAVAAALKQLDDRTVEWLQDIGAVINDDATVKLVKAVTKGTYASMNTLPDGSKTIYSPGAKIEAPDYERDHQCGRGLHFSANFRDARRWAHGPVVGMECDVDLATLIYINHQKVKAKSCTVVGEIANANEADLYNASSRQYPFAPKK